MTGTICNIAAELRHQVDACPDRVAVVWPTRRLAGGTWATRSRTFRELDQQSDLAALGLKALGVERGTRVALMVPPSLEFFTLVFALFKIGAVLLCLDPGIGAKRIGRCLEQARPRALLGSVKALLALRLFGWAKHTIHLLVGTSLGSFLLGARSVGGLLRLGQSELKAAGEARAGRGRSDAEVVLPEALRTRPLDLAPTLDEEIAAILFTSGSTGAPKGVLYSHGQFVAQLRALKEMFEIEPGEVDLSTFPLFALFAPGLGMTSVIPRMDFTRPKDASPRRLKERIEQMHVTHLFGSPALLDRLGRAAEEHQWKLPTLKRVVSAGAPVSARIVQRMAACLSQPAEVHTPYGATECLPVASIGSRELLHDTRSRTEAGYGVCVGRAAPRTEIRILRIDDGPIERLTQDLEVATGEIGEIVVHGPTTTLEYDGLPEATLLAKIRDEHGRIWHRMGDLGRFDEHGRLWFCGRKSERVRLDSGELYTTPCESVFDAHPMVKRSSLVGARTRDGALRPVLWVELDPDTRTLDPVEVRRELRELGRRHPQTRGIDDIRFHCAFPVDARHNAKIDRTALARLAERENK